MPIKCLFGDYTSHDNEKKMLDKFLSQLVPVYGGDRDPWVYVIYNAMWSGQEIDLVCITQNSIVVTDLKNYSGSLIGQENGEWVMNNLNGEEITVKGGGQINPFVQVRKNRYAVMEWLKTENLLMNDNIGHMAGLILFTEIKEAQIKLSHGVSQWFHVSDIPHINQHLPVYGSKEINIAESEVQDIVKALHLQEYAWTPLAPITAQYDPFTGDGTKASRSLEAVATAKPKVVLPKPVIDPPSKLKAIHLPMVALLAVAGVVGYGFVDQLQKKDSWVANTVNELTPSLIKNVFSVTGLSVMGELRNHPDDLLLYGEHPEKITHFDPKREEKLWTTFQLLDLEKGTVYGMKIGETTFEEVEALNLRNDTVFLAKSDVVPGQVRNIHQLVNPVQFDLPKETLKKLETYHPKLPQLDIDHLEFINIWFSPEGIVRGVGFEVDDREKQAILPYLRRYKSLGYQVQEGSIAGHVGYSYAVLAKGNEVIVLNDPHMRPLSIVHTNKATFESNREHLIKSKESSTIPLGKIRKL